MCKKLSAGKVQVQSSASRGLGLFSRLDFNFGFNLDLALQSLPPSTIFRETNVQALIPVFVAKNSSLSSTLFHLRLTSLSFHPVPFNPSRP